MVWAGIDFGKIAREKIAIVVSAIARRIVLVVFILGLCRRKYIA